MFKKMRRKESIFDFEILLWVVGKDLHSKNVLEHCMLTGLGVRYRFSGKSKWKFRVMG